MELSPLQILATVVGTGGATSITQAFLGWMTQRSKDQTIARSDVEKAARELIETALASAGDQIAWLQSEVQTLRTEIAELRREHDDCEDGRTEDRRKIDRLEEEMTRFMNGDGSPNVARYTSIRRNRKSG